VFALYLFSVIVADDVGVLCVAVVLFVVRIYVVVVVGVVVV